MKRKESEMNTKERAVGMSIIGNNNDIFRELGIKKTSYNCWTKKIKVREFDHCFGQKNPELTDLEHENICLQKMINAAKREQALLKAAINYLECAK